MKTNRKLSWFSWRPSSLPLLALTSTLMVMPSSARAAGDFVFLQLTTKDASTFDQLASYAGKLQSGISIATTVLTWTGMLNPGVQLSDIQTEMGQIAGYQDQSTKYGLIGTYDTPYSNAISIMQERILTNPDGTFAGVDPYYQPFLDADSDSAVNDFLNPKDLCTNGTIWQTLNFSSPGAIASPETYEWRLGLSRALGAVTARLMALAMLDPLFATTNMYKYLGELIPIRACLINHRDIVHPPKPFSFCDPNGVCNQGGCGCYELECGEHRSGPLWNVTNSSVPFPLCQDYVFGSASYASHVQYEDLTAAATAKIEHDDLPVLFPLQRMIDTLYLLTSQTPDLTQTNQTIPFGANPQLCLSSTGGSQNGIDNPSLQNCSNGPSVNWTYDRATGRIKNTTSGRCLAGPTPGSPVGLSPCTTDASDETQIWNWNTETQKIKSPLGYAIAVTDSIPQAGSVVSAQYEHSWRLHQQVWTSGVSSTCTGAICPAPGPAAWNQGSIPGYSERYPIDFNIFTYLSAVGLTDVEGPVAAHGRGWTTSATTNWGTLGGISAQYFSLNSNSGMPVAAISGGDILNLSGGTVFGQVLADPSATASVYPSVTFRIAGTGVQTVPDPVNFEMAFVKLQGMSSSLRNAPTGTVGVKNSVMTLTSTIPNANPQIFDISGSMFGNYGYNVTSMVFVGVPDTATVVINVSGTSISISNTGITGLPGYNGTIWNFYEATNVNLASVGIVGSILAPFANVHATSGFVTGTVAAWSFGGKWAESHYGRFHNNALVTGS